MNPATEFGSNLGLLWETDPRMICIRMARYKFVAKMLAGEHCVLEVGAGDGVFSRIVRAAVLELDLCDPAPQGPGVERLDLVRETPRKLYRGIYALDVLEHIAPADEDAFLGNICAALTPYGTLVVGMPSLESQPYGHPLSKAGHVNCKTEDQLRATLGRFFTNTYLFGMNDETLHTGFGPMCHYRLAVCTGVVS